MKKQKNTEEPIVHCSDCALFVRDAEGRSFSIDTGEFFLGICMAGCVKPKTFANKPRRCEKFKENKN